MARVLVLNFLFIALPLLLIAAGIFLIAKGRTMGRRCLGILLVALATGPILYIAAGIVAGRLRGDKYFYGVPFGGYLFGDSTEVGIGLMIWVCLIIAILAGMLRWRA